MNLGRQVVKSKVYTDGTMSVLTVNVLNILQNSLNATFEHFSATLSGQVNRENAP